MSDNNFMKTDPIQINIVDEDDTSSNYMDLNFDFEIVNADEFNAYYNSNNFNDSSDSNGDNKSSESPGSTQGPLVEAETSNPALTPVVIPVLPRRRNSGMIEEECELFQGIQNTDDEQMPLEREDLSDRDDSDEEPRESRSAAVIGRNHPASSPAALAGYRYRIR